MSLDLAPCEAWPYDDTCCTGLPEPVDPNLLEAQQLVATRLLWAASGRRYGPCPVTIRPCVRRCLGGTLPVPYKGSDGAWRNFSACGCSDDCSCVELCEVILPGPVSEILEVSIDGVPLGEDQYRLDRRNSGYRLVRTDGGCFPDCQDLTASCDEDGSFCVTYDYGLPLDELAVAAYSQLVCQLVKACTPDCVCELPANVTSVVRRGVTITYENALPWLRILPLVAAWLDTVNPAKLTSASGVWSPDVPPIRRTLSPGSVS